jgi:predicted TIM-barrel fold metal-dependent hydrolase
MISQENSIIDSHVLLGRENHLSLEVFELLDRMNASHVDIAVARPVGAELVVENTRGNDRLLEAGSRVKAMVSVNPWYAEKAIDELRRCHDLGAVGLFLQPARQGFFPTERIADPIVSAAAGFGWPIMFHTGTFLYSDILAVAELARRYPETNFIAGFGGFTDMWFELPSIFSEIENLFLDASLIWGDAISQLVSSVGADRVLFASAEPRNHYPVVFKCLKRLNLTAEQRSLILGDNARRLFKLE